MWPQDRHRGGLYPRSFLDQMVSLAAANNPIVMRNTPGVWKTTPTNRTCTGTGPASYATPLGGGGTAAGKGGGGTTPGGRTGTGAGTERKRPADKGGGVAKFIKNDKMHSKLIAVMKPIHDRGIEINIGQLCRESDITFEQLPHTGTVKICYRWILGYCGENTKCNKNLAHSAGTDISDELASKIANTLAPGIAKIVTKFDEAAANKKQKENK